MSDYLKGRPRARNQSAFRSFPMAANGRALATGATDGMVKVVAEAGSDKLLGVQIVAHGASELIASAVAHMEYGGSAEDLHA